MKKNHRILILAAALGSAASSSHAATILWSSSNFDMIGDVPGSRERTMATGQFNTTGTKIFAENSGGSAVTFDGIDFTDASTSGFSFLGGIDPGFHYGDPVALASTGSWSFSSSSTVNLTGLSVGYSYRIQALIADSRSDYYGRKVSFDGINQGVYAKGVAYDTWGDALLVTGTFTANSTSQSFTIQNFNADNSSAGSQVNALTLYQTAIPEPSAAALAGLAGLGLALRRRRAH